MLTDPIADMLSRIRNAALARHDRADMPYSGLREHLANVLKGEGFIDDVRVAESDTGLGPKTLTLVLRYGRNKESAIDGIKPRLDPRSPRLRPSRPYPARPLGSRGLDPEHQQGRHDRQGVPQAACWRRAPLRGLVMAAHDRRYLAQHCREDGAQPDRASRTSSCRASASGPVELPKGVTFTLKDGVMEVKGPKGSLTRPITPQVSIKVDTTGVARSPPRRRP